MIGIFVHALDMSHVWGVCESVGLCVCEGSTHRVSLPGQSFIPKEHKG